MEMILPYYFLLFLCAVGVSGIRISEQKCDDYWRVQPLISTKFNETDENAGPKEIPFMAKIRNGTHFQSGTLISENFVLSTAIAFSSKIYVELGEFKMFVNDDDSRTRRYDVIQQITHPDFVYGEHSFNIKLFRLNESIKFDEYVRPACLPPNEFSIPMQLKQFGWDKPARSNWRLHEVKFNYISDESCKEIFTKRGLLKVVGDIDDATLFCARSKVGERWMCKVSGNGFFSNSGMNIKEFGGSPLIIVDHRAMKIAGLSSYYLSPLNCSVCLNCTESPLAYVFVSVSAHIDWIESIVWPGTQITTKRVIIEGGTTESQTTERVTTELTQIPSEMEEELVEATTYDQTETFDQTKGMGPISIKPESIETRRKTFQHKFQFKHNNLFLCFGCIQNVEISEKSP